MRVFVVSRDLRVGRLVAGELAGLGEVGVFSRRGEVWGVFQGPLVLVDLDSQEVLVRGFGVQADFRVRVEKSRVPLVLSVLAVKGVEFLEEVEKSGSR